MAQRGNTSTSRLDQLGLSETDTARLTTWMPELAIELSPPGTPVRRNANEIRIGRKGSLVVYDDGGWYSYEADEGGHGARSLIAFLRPDIEPVALRWFALNWLKSHPGSGSGSGDEAAIDAALHARRAQYAELAAQVLREIRSGHGTPVQQYLESRGITGDWPVNLVGYVTDAERPGEGAIVGVITDANGAPVGIQLGYLDAQGCKVELGGATRRQYLVDHETPVYGFHVVPAAPEPALPLLLCEGLENALSLGMAWPQAEIIGLPGIGRMRRLPPFRGQEIVVFRDGDAADSPASRTLTAGIDHLLIGGANVKLTATPVEADANSILQKGGIAAIQALVESAAPATLSPKGVVKQGAAHNELDYQLARRQLAKSIGIKVGALDAQVARERARRRGNDDDPSVEDEDIHPGPVTDIVAVLDAARAEVGQYVVADAMQLDTAVMWGLHTHFVHHAIIDLAISPRLLITAPSPECGKTTLLEASGELTARPLELSSISPAAFFRLNDAERPTLLIDELQGLLGRKGNNAEFEAILNASHRRRSATTVRVEENEHKKLVPRRFESWCTYAATVSGRLSYAMESRGLKVTLRRALVGEVKKHLQDGTSELLVECRRKFARWAKDQLGLPEVVLPPVLANRRGDNWRPLFRIAALAAGHWPQRIEAAALAAMGQTVSVDVIVALLTDAREIIGERDHILTAELIAALRSLEDPNWDWNTGCRGGPVNAYWLRDRLTDVLDPPGTQGFWIGKTARRGYTAGQFHDAYDRYLNRHNPDEQPPSGPETHTEKGGISRNSSARTASVIDNPLNTKDNTPLADGENRSTRVSAREGDPLENGNFPSGWGPLADPQEDQVSASARDKNQGNSGATLNRSHVKRIKSGKTVHSLSLSQKPASEPQPDGEEDVHIW